MKNILFKLLTISFIILQSCSNNDSDINNSNTNNNANVDYEFTLTIDTSTYKIKGRTNGFEYNTNGLNWCWASSANIILFSIADVSDKSFVTGMPISFSLVANSPSNFILGINQMSINLEGYSNKNSLYLYPATIPVTITDLGTKSTRDPLNPLNFIYGKTIKGNYKGVLYSASSGSLYATVPHNVSLDFSAVRLY